MRRENRSNSSTLIHRGALVALTAAASLGCFGTASAESRLANSDTPPEASKVRSVSPASAHSFPTIEGAVRHGVEHARATARHADRDRLRGGSILRVEQGYRWEATRRSGSAHRPLIRITLGAEHVATYVLHPRTGIRAVDRANERITKRERRLVDDVDSKHRPIFVSTPSGRLLRYGHASAISKGSDPVAPPVAVASRRDMRNQPSR